MSTRIRVWVLAAAALLSLSSVTQAGQPFNEHAFQQAQAAGKTILVDISATWCPTCKAQKPIVGDIEKHNPQLVVLDVDFDTATSGQAGIQCDADR